MDTFDKVTRSRVMRQNKSTGSKSTERRFRSLLMRHRFRGWKIGCGTTLPGRPDIIFVRKRLAIFIDGCFWHGCRRCRTIPNTNRAFWLTKIEGNRKRDKKSVQVLKALGWKVVRLWEHELRNGALVLTKLRRAISASNRSRSCPSTVRFLKKLR